jgi:hypothetical protein
MGIRGVRKFHRKFLYDLRVSKSKRDFQSEMFFKHLITLWEPSDKDQVLLAGQHSWSFTFELPVNLPPTIYFEVWRYLEMKLKSRTGLRYFISAEDS